MTRMSARSLLRDRGIISELHSAAADIFSLNDFLSSVDDVVEKIVPEPAVNLTIRKFCRLMIKSISLRK